MPLFVGSLHSTAKALLHRPFRSAFPDAAPIWPHRKNSDKSPYLRPVKPVLCRPISPQVPGVDRYRPRQTRNHSQGDPAIAVGPRSCRRKDGSSAATAQSVFSTLLGIDSQCHIARLAFAFNEQCNRFFRVELGDDIVELAHRFNVDIIYRKNDVALANTGTFRSPV